MGNYLLLQVMQIVEYHERAAKDSNFILWWKIQHVNIKHFDFTEIK